MKVKKQKKGLVLKLSHEQIKAGGFLPILVAIATAIGALAGAGAAIAISVISAKHQKAEETQRHNAEMEKISQEAKSVTIGAGLKKEEIESLSNFDIIRLVKTLKIKHFRDFL